MITATHRRHSLLVTVACISLLAAPTAAPAQTYDFSVNNGGFTKPGSYNNWGYEPNAGKWYEVQQLEIANKLVTPVVIANGGAASLDLLHVYSLSAYYDFYGAIHCYDAGIIEVSVNGGAFTSIAPDRGSLYNGTIDANHTNPAYGQHGFCGSLVDPAIPTLSGWDMTFAAGDHVQFAFDATWDATNGAPAETWELRSVALTGFGGVPVSAAPEPTSAMLLGTGLLGMGAVARWRRRTQG
jgi:hypothetical protein